MDTLIRPEIGTVSYPGGAVSIAEIRLGGTPRGTVLVVGEEGRLSHTAPEILNRFAEHGYSAVAAEIAPPERAEVRGALAALLDRIRSSGVPDAQLGVVGYGDGARAAFALAVCEAVGAAVGVASAPGPLPGGTESRTLTTPWLGMYARAGDHGQALHAFLADQTVYSRTVMYPDATPGFFRANSPASDHAAAFESWQRTLEWLNLRVEPCPTPFAQGWAAREHERTRPTRTGLNGD